MFVLYLLLPLLVVLLRYWYASRQPQPACYQPLGLRSRIQPVRPYCHLCWVQLGGSFGTAYRNYVLADDRSIALCTACLTDDSTLRWLAKVLPTVPAATPATQPSSRSRWPMLKRGLLIVWLGLVVLNGVLLFSPLLHDRRLQTAALGWLLLTLWGAGQLHRRWRH